MAGGAPTPPGISSVRSPPVHGFCATAPHAGSDETDMIDREEAVARLMDMVAFGVTLSVEEYRANGTTSLLTQRIKLTHAVVAEAERQLDAMARTRETCDAAGIAARLIFKARRP